MKIGCLFLASLGNVGGVEVFTFNFLGKLSSLGHECTLYITKRAYNNIRRYVDGTSFKISPFFFETSRPFRYTPFLMKPWFNFIQMRESYDIWQIMGAYPAADAALWLQNKVPTVLRAHGDDIQRDDKLNYGVVRDPRKAKSVRRALRVVDRVIAMTQTMQQSYLDLQVEPDKIVNIPNTVEVARFEVESDTNGLRQKLGVQSNTRLLITVGRYHIKKGHDLIPEIALRLRQQFKDFKWIVVGQGVEKLRDEIQAKQLNGHFVLQETSKLSGSLSNDGRFMVPSDNLIALIKAADVSVFPTRLEGFPMVIIEAMAAGLPIVTTKSPGVREVVEDGETALVSKTDDVDAMAFNIHRLLENGVLCKYLTANGKREVIKYDLSRVTQEYINLYESLLDKN